MVPVMRVVVVALASAAFAGAVGCVDQVPAPPPPVPVTSVAFNVAGNLIDDPVTVPHIADQLAALHPDFAELEE
jgi:hypothetical protein